MKIIGGGFAYQYGTYTLNKYYYFTEWGDKLKQNSAGPVGNIRMRFAMGQRKKNIEAKFSYMKSLREDKISALCLAALFNF